MLVKPKRKLDQSLIDKIHGERCCICNAFPVDASHIKSRGSGGPDEEFNVVAHCRNHHVEWHQMGPSRFLKKYPSFALKLKLMGWDISEGRLTHPKLFVSIPSET